MFYIARKEKMYDALSLRYTCAPVYLLKKKCAAVINTFLICGVLFRSSIFLFLYFLVFWYPFHQESFLQMRWRHQGLSHSLQICIEWGWQTLSFATMMGGRLDSLKLSYKLGKVLCLVTVILLSLRSCLVCKMAFRWLGKYFFMFFAI